MDNEDLLDFPDDYSDDLETATMEEEEQFEDNQALIEPEIVGIARAVVRFRAGTVAWSENMYRVQSLSRQRDDDYRNYQRENWQERKNAYNAQRRQRRQEARQQMEALGLEIRNGRPKHPKAIEAVPPEVAHNLNTDQLVFLSDESLFQNITKSIPVPTEELKAYLRTPVVLIDSRPLQWGMFRFLPWKELVGATRRNYVANARLALKDAGYLTPDRKDLIDKHLVFHTDRDKEFAEETTNVAEAGEQEVFQDVEVLENEDGELVPADQAPQPLNQRTQAPQQRKQRKKYKPRAVLLTQNPIAIVDFMLEVGVDPWKLVTDTFETNNANARGAGLASVCYAYLRRLYDRNEYNTNAFNLVLEWSEIFRKYTSIARQQTGEKHATQIASPSDVANTVPWDEWRIISRKFIEYYFEIDGDTVKVRESIDPVRPHLYNTRPQTRTATDSVTGQTTEVTFNPQPPPWWNSDGTYPTAPRRPNLRELRDACIVACYSLLAPIRLDWAGTELVEHAPQQDTSAKKNVLLVDSIQTPTMVTNAYFAKFKNRKKFFTNPLGFPLPKFVSKESPLCANILLAYLQERKRQGFRSHCLFPYNAFKSEDLRPDQCFTNEAFGQRLADLSWDLTGKNFRETFMRRSYIQWFWNQPGHDPLDQSTWDSLLPTVHQTSSKVNIGYIKKANEKLEQWKATHKNYSATQLLEVVKELRTKALSQVPELEEGDVEEAVEPKQPLFTAEQPPEAQPAVVINPFTAPKKSRGRPPKTPVPPPPPIAPTPPPKSRDQTQTEPRRSVRTHKRRQFF